MDNIEFLETKLVWFKRYSSVSWLDRKLCGWFGHEPEVVVFKSSVVATCKRCWAQQRIDTASVPPGGMVKLFAKGSGYGC